MTRNEFAHRYGPTALITGGAQGIGRGFAMALAERGLELFLVDFNAEMLERTALELRQAGAKVDTLHADLTLLADLDEVCSRAKSFDLGLLINNAGSGHVGDFLSIPLENHLNILDLCVRAPLMLTHRLAPTLRERGRGGLIFLSSTSALQGSPSVTHYAATKAYNWSLAEGLFGELAADGVDSLALLPGFTDSAANRRALSREDLIALGAMAPRDVAEQALAALGRQPYIIAGLRNRWRGWLMSRFAPRRWVLRKRARQNARAQGPLGRFSAKQH